MHEVGLMQSTLALAMEHAAREGAHRVHRLTLRVGLLSGAVPEALEFAFDVLARGTMAEGARLEIERVPIVCYCRACAREFEATDLVCECSQCGRPSAEVRHGRELELASLEVS